MNIKTEMEIDNKKHAAVHCKKFLSTNNIHFSNSSKKKNIVLHEKAIDMMCCGNPEYITT